MQEYLKQYAPEKIEMALNRVNSGSIFRAPQIDILISEAVRLEASNPSVAARKLKTALSLSSPYAPSLREAMERLVDLLPVLTQEDPVAALEYALFVEQRLKHQDDPLCDKIRHNASSLIEKAGQNLVKSIGPLLSIKRDSVLEPVALAAMPSIFEPLLEAASQPPQENKSQKQRYRLSQDSFTFILEKMTIKLLNAGSEAEPLSPVHRYAAKILREIFTNVDRLVTPDAVEGLKQFLHIMLEITKPFDDGIPLQRVPASASIDPPLPSPPRRGGPKLVVSKPEPSEK